MLTNICWFTSHTHCKLIVFEKQLKLTRILLHFRNHIMLSIILLCYNFDSNFLERNSFCEANSGSNVPWITLSLWYQNGHLLCHYDYPNDHLPYAYGTKTLIYPVRMVPKCSLALMVAQFSFTLALWYPNVLLPWPYGIQMLIHPVIMAGTQMFIYPVLMITQIHAYPDSMIPKCSFILALW